METLSPSDIAYYGISLNQSIILSRIGYSTGGILGLFSGIMLLTALVPLIIPETKGQSLAAIEVDMMHADSSSTTDLNPDVDDSVKRKENLSRTVLLNYSLHSLLCVVASPSAYIYFSL
jgi:hypothetical protein